MASNECFFNAKGAGKGNYVKNGLIWAVMGLITREIGHDKVQHWGLGKFLTRGRIGDGENCSLGEILHSEKNA